MKYVLDPRIKLYLLLLAVLYLSLQMSIRTESLVFIIYVLPFFGAGLFKWGLAFTLIYIVQLVLASQVLPTVRQPFLAFTLSYLTNGFRILLPSIMMGAYSIKTTTVSEWIATFKKLHFPNWLIIPLAVMVRFFSTIYEDYKHIRKAMAFRGIGNNAWDLIKNPIQSLEYILIPLLMNATKVAEDLTISSLSKGLTLKGKQTSITQLHMQVYDWMYIFVALIPFFLYSEVVL